MKIVHFNLYRLSKQAETFISKSPNYENIESGIPRPTELIRSYRNLYSEARVQAFDAIEEILRTDGGGSDDERVNDVKTKLLFSVIVVSHFPAVTKFLPRFINRVSFRPMRTSRSHYEIQKKHLQYAKYAGLAQLL